MCWAKSVFHEEGRWDGCPCGSGFDLVTLPFPSSALPHTPASSSPDLCQQVQASHLYRKTSSLRFSLKCEEMLLEAVRYLTPSSYKSLVPVGLGPIPRPIPVTEEVPCTDRLRSRWKKWNDRHYLRQVRGLPWSWERWWWGGRVNAPNCRAAI